MKNLAKLPVSKRVIMGTVFDSLIELVSPVYDADEGHGWKHINEVFDRCIKLHLFIKGKERIDESSYIVYKLASLLHDVYSSANRKEHHILAKALISNLLRIKYIKIDNGDTSELLEKQVMSTIPKQDGSNWKIDSFKFLDFVTITELTNAMDCVINHRSSGTPNFTTEYGEIFAAADNDVLDIRQVLGRIHSCSVHDTNYVIPELTPVEEELLKGFYKQDIRTYLHLKEKFSRNGYMFDHMKEDGVYMKFYKDTIYDFWRDVDEVLAKPMLIMKYVREYYGK